MLLFLERVYIHNEYYRTLNRQHEIKTECLKVLNRHIFNSDVKIAMNF